MRVSCRFLNLSATVAGHPREKPRASLTRMLRWTIVRLKSSPGCEERVGVATGRKGLPIWPRRRKLSPGTAATRLVVPCSRNGSTRRTTAQKRETSSINWPHAAANSLGCLRGIDHHLGLNVSHHPSSAFKKSSKTKTPQTPKRASLIFPSAR